MRLIVKEKKKKLKKKKLSTMKGKIMGRGISRELCL